VPKRNPEGRYYYYLIVEPVTPDGRIFSLPVTSEEDGETVTTSKWGVRVSDQVAIQVPRDDTMQWNRLGDKRRGYLNVDYLMPVLDGAITQW
jgi:hypothetical protein